ncbi:MAG: leucine-rich repeat domain-containing protein [Clostridia bacterium]|nr:leucine-rich repeat domain-containing protein [Clostridia bacterium]
MKLFKNLLALLVALTCIFAVVACDNGETSEELDTTKHGWAYEYEIEEASDENDNKSYVVITGLFLADGEKFAVSEGVYESIGVNIGTEIKVPVYDKKTKKEVYENDNLKTETLALGEDYAGFKIADAAFASQLIINKVTLGEKVVEVGSGAFAGCSNIEEMTLSFVGATAGENLNQKKLFAYLFGASEASNCTSVTCKYNESGSATYYVPNALKKVTVNAQGTQLGAYAFNGLSTLENIVINGALTSIGNYAFEGCSSAYNVTIPATVETLGKGAFKNCAKLINFEFPTALTTIYQEAFYGCSRLGYGKNTVVDLANVTHVYDKAFYNCGSISSVNLANVEVIGESAFYSCASLETVALNPNFDGKNEGVNAFGKTPYDESKNS